MKLIAATGAWPSYMSGCVPRFEGIFMEFDAQRWKRVLAIIIALDFLYFCGYNISMSNDIELEWDEDKRMQTLKERNLDFKLARYVLADPHLVRYIDNA